MAQVLEQFQREVQKVEELQKKASTMTVVPSTSTLQGATAAMTMTPGKLNKAPKLPAFSGAEPTPKNEISTEQWLWQV